MGGVGPPLGDGRGLAPSALSRACLGPARSQKHVVLIVLTKNVRLPWVTGRACGLALCCPHPKCVGPCRAAEGHLGDPLRLPPCPQDLTERGGHRGTAV